MPWRGVLILSVSVYGCAHGCCTVMFGLRWRQWKFHASGGSCGGGGGNDRMTTHRGWMLHHKSCPAVLEVYDNVTFAAGGAAADCLWSSVRHAHCNESQDTPRR